MRNVIYFMDTDKDDIYSLIILLAQHYHQTINLKAIICDDGFLSYPENISLTSFILNYLEIDIPIYKGVERNSYLKQHRNFPPEFISSYLEMMKKNFNYQFSKINKPYIDVLMKELYKEDSLEILVTGNLTSLSYILRRYPLIQKNINKVTIMGGNINTKGNVLPQNPKHNFILPNAEYNFWLDPDSISDVLEILRGKVEIVPLDCTNFAPLNKNIINEIKCENYSFSKKDKFLTKLYNTFIKLLETTLETENGNLYLWDLVATLIFLNYDIKQRVNFIPLKISMTGKLTPYFGNKHIFYESINFQIMKKTILHSIFKPNFISDT